MNKQDIQDRLCLFVDKLNCSARMALKRGFVLHPDYWNLYYAPPYHDCATKLVWLVNNAVNQLPPGAANKRIHPLSFMLVDRYTITANKGVDIDRIMGFPAGVMDHGFFRGFRTASSNSLDAETLDSQHKTTIYTQAWNLGKYCMNALFGYSNAYTVSGVLNSAVEKAFKDIYTVKP